MRMPPIRKRCCTWPCRSPRRASIRRRSTTSIRDASTARCSTRSTSLRSAGASIQAGAERRGGVARRVGRRQDLDDQGSPGHLLRRRSGFQGETARRLTAGDFVYAWKRILDPKMRSPALAVLDGKIERHRGADRGRQKARRPIRLRCTDREACRRSTGTTIRLKFDQPEYSLLSDLTTINTAAVAREVIEAYSDSNGWAMANPVGSGPYRLKEWRRGQRIVLEGESGLSRPALSRQHRSRRQGVARDDARQKIPMIGRIEISIMEESNPRLLAFQGGDTRLPADPQRADLERAESGPEAQARSSPSAASASAPASSPRSSTPTSTWRTRWSAG